MTSIQPFRPTPEPLAFVAFDFDGTLTDFVQADLRALDTLRRHACPQIEAQAFVDRAVDEIMAFHERVEAGTSDPLRMHAERLGRTLSAYDVICTPGHLGLYVAALIRETRPLSGAAELLTALRQRGLRLALLSNAYDGPEQRARIDACFPERPFEVVVIAGEGEALKPDPRPFAAMLTQLGLSANRGVYVGDSPRHDVVGARASGLRAVLVHPHPSVQEQGKRLGAVHAVSRLGELLPLLAR
ncbi:HAD family hydrolase [Deinococcus saxicola]|uniref:HAD family hydrolase n=1 Tax=Deinococcus saxicola TaxID=249406 RepID=UPI0039F0AA35